MDASASVYSVGCSCHVLPIGASDAFFSSSALCFLFVSNKHVRTYVAGTSLPVRAHSTSPLATRAAHPLPRKSGGGLGWYSILSSVFYDYGEGRQAGGSFVFASSPPPPLLLLSSSYGCEEATAFSVSHLDHLFFVSSNVQTYEPEAKATNFL